MLIFRTLIFILLTSLATGAGAATFWTMKIDTDEEVALALAAMNRRHPNFFRNQIRYSTDYAKLFHLASRRIKAMGVDASRALEIRPQPIVGLTVTSSGLGLGLDELKIAKLKEQLNQRLVAVHSSKIELSELKSDLRGIKGWPKADRLRFLEVVPLLYAESGLSLKQNDLNSLAAGELQALYTDAFPEHLKPMIESVAGEHGLGEYSELLQKLENGFFKSVLNPAFQPLAASEGEAASSVFLEEVPGIFALLRGGVGFDCAMRSVPYYSLLNGVRTFWIRKNANVNEAPRGYLLLAEVKTAEGIVPYILTVNGATLSSEEARAAVLAALSFYGSKSVIVADKAVEGLVNSPAMDVALWRHTNRGEKISIELPSGWEKARGFEPTYKDYYAAEKLKANARLIRLDADEARKSNLTRPTGKAGFYHPVDDIQKMSIFDRATLHAQLSTTLDDKKLSALLRTSNEEVELAELITVDRPVESISSAAALPFYDGFFQQAEKLFGLRPLAVFKLWDVERQARLLMYAEEDQLVKVFALGERRQLITEVREKLLHQLELEGQGAKPDLKKLMIKFYLLISLPKAANDDHFLDDFIVSGGPINSAMKINRLELSVDWPKHADEVLSRYSPKQPKWLRWLVLVANAEKTPAERWTRTQLLAMDPSPDIRAEALSYVRFTAGVWNGHAWNTMRKVAAFKDLLTRREASAVWNSVRGFLPEWAWDIQIDYLNDPNAIVRAHTLKTIASQRSWPEVVWRRVIELMSDEDDVVRESALNSLHGRKWPREVWQKIPEVLRAEVKKYPYSFTTVVLADLINEQSSATYRTLTAIKDILAEDPFVGRKDVLQGNEARQASARHTLRTRYKVLKGAPVDEFTIKSLDQTTCEFWLGAAKSSLSSLYKNWF